MGVFGNTLGLPLTGPLRGLGWLARQIAEAASREMTDPAPIEAELLALERQMQAGEIDEATFEAREAELLARLADMTRPAEPETAAATEPQGTTSPTDPDTP
jgi:hypothetical protein